MVSITLTTEQTTKILNALNYFMSHHVKDGKESQEYLDLYHHILNEQINGGINTYD